MSDKLNPEQRTFWVTAGLKSRLNDNSQALTPQITEAVQGAINTAEAIERLVIAYQRRAELLLTGPSINQIEQILQNSNIDL
jgi:hypothetical protein